MQRQSRAEHSGLSVCPWSPVLWISGACGKAEAARIGFSCVLLCNSKWQHKSFLHYSLRIMLIHNGGNVTSSLFTYEAKTCHGSILTVGIVGEVECSHSQARSHRAGAKRMCCVFPDISRYASIRPSFQELLRSPQKKKKRNSKMDDIINRHDIRLILMLNLLPWQQHLHTPILQNNVPSSTMKGFFSLTL